MMTLEQRARRAAEAIDAGIAAYEPAAGIADVARRHGRRRATGVAAAGLAVFAALVAGTWLAGPSADEVAEPPPSTVPIAEPPIPAEPLVTTGPSPAEIAPPTAETPVPEPSPAPAPVDPIGRDDAEPDAGGVALPPATRPPATTLPPEPAPGTTVLVDTEPPALAVTFPADGDTFDRKTVRFTGTTEPGATVTAGRFAAEVDEAGNWALVLVLNEGGNRAKFRATDAAGNESTVTLTVYYEKVVEEPPPPDAQFTAHALYGSCSFDPPYDVYHGTAEPGAKITISSEYGGATTYANDKGHWEKKVFFPEAPPEVPFLVTVKDQAGHAKRFEFVSLVGV